MSKKKNKKFLIENNFSFFTVSICTELAICIVSMRGSILDTGPRASMHYWLYIKLGKYINGRYRNNGWMQNNLTFKLSLTKKKKIK